MEELFQTTSLIKSGHLIFLFNANEALSRFTFILRFELEGSVLDCILSGFIITLFASPIPGGLCD